MKTKKIKILKDKKGIYTALQKRIINRNNEKVIKMNIDEFINKYQDISIESLKSFKEISTYENGAKYKFEMSVKYKLQLGMLIPNYQNAFWIEGDFIYKKRFLIDEIVELVSPKSLEKLGKSFNTNFNQVYGTYFDYYSDEFISKYSDIRMLKYRFDKGTLDERIKAIYITLQRKRKLKDILGDN